MPPHTKSEISPISQWTPQHLQLYFAELHSAPAPNTWRQISPPTALVSFVLRCERPASLPRRTGRQKKKSDYTASSEALINSESNKLNSPWPQVGVDPGVYPCLWLLPANNAERKLMRLSTARSNRRNCSRKSLYLIEVLEQKVFSKPAYFSFFSANPSQVCKRIKASGSQK